MGVPNLPLSAGVISPVFETLRNIDTEHVRTSRRRARAYRSPPIVDRWALMSTGEAAAAEVSFVFRGGKGVGKGILGHALRKLFGQHGVETAR